MSNLAPFPSDNLLRFITCGSVDDGKSTLIGRMLFESGSVADDHLEALKNDSKKFGTVGDELDFALLIDGLSAEREQGITIDVAYRYFSSGDRKFVVADTPGHEQYTRNMATGASNADLAVIMVDARKGLLPQTKRHSYIVSLLGVKQVVVAINKMDLVNYDESIYNKIALDFHENAEKLGFDHIETIPLSALKGDNVVSQSSHMPWYDGLPLLSYLETVKLAAINKKHHDDNFAMPVQWVNRPNLDFRGFSGTIAEGRVRKGQEIIALPSNKCSKIKSIVSADGEHEAALAGDAITLTLEDEIDLSRGDVIMANDAKCSAADIFKTHLIWMNQEAMVAGRQYIFQASAFSAKCTLSKPNYKIDVHDYEQMPSKNLKMNEIGVCDLYLDRPCSFLPFKQNKMLGSFILINQLTNETVAMGMIDHSMRRAHNVYEQDMSIDRAARSDLKGQKPCVIWMTGLSGAGKSTIANIVEQKLYAQHKHTITLDGDNVRHGLNKDLGFSETDRAENIRRIAEVSKLMLDTGTITIVSFISPFAAERQLARDIIGEDNFIEVFVDTPLNVAEDRDVKGLYKKARKGEIPNFTGIGSPYQAPRSADIRLETVSFTAEELADQIIDYLKNNGSL